MVQVKQDKDWGPTTQVLPLKDIGGPLVVTPPKPPKLPKQVEAPKPVEVVKPSINRDPQALLEEFRKIAKSVRTDEQIKRDIDQYNSDRDAFFTSKSGNIDDAFVEWDKNNKHRLESLWKEQQSKPDVSRYIPEMHKLLFSDKPQKIDIELGSNIPKENRDAFTNIIKYVSNFIDNRPLSLSEVSMLSSDIELNNMYVGIDIYKNVDAYCSTSGNGSIMLNSNRVKLSKTFNNTFGKRNTPTLLAHEMMHWLDNRDPELRKRIDAFYRKRTAGDAWRPSPYGGKYKKDKWLDAYMGQRYEYLELSGLGQEVPTMGMELLLQNPLKFAEDDFEHFSFMVTEVLGLGK
jgi:hypothetical protein